MKFNLMYYMGLSYYEVMTLNLAELNWYIEQLTEVKQNEAEIEKIKFEAMLTAMGAGATKRNMPLPS